MPYKVNKEESITVRLPASLMRSLERAAKKNGVTMSEAFRWAVQVVYYNPRQLELQEDIGGGAKPAELFLPDLVQHLEGIVAHNREVAGAVELRLVEVRKLVDEFRVRAEVLAAQRYGQQRLSPLPLPRKSRAKA
ncbi:MAG: hypothetical protein JW388_0347 [Nitrospira sp.]|nr:hypothetical protein [Nitrospira sp.]